jgi:hypothetical protein
MSFVSFEHFLPLSFFIRFCKGKAPPKGGAFSWFLREIIVGNGLRAVPR